MESFDPLVIICASAIRLGVPLILACLAGLWSERSGVVDIGLEGKMLTGAFAAAVAATFTGSAWIGLLAGVAATRRRLADPRLRLDRPARQPDRLRHRDQHGRRRHDGADRQRDLEPGRAHAATARRSAVSADHAAVRRGDRRRADRRARIYRNLISGHDLVTYFAFVCVPLTYWALYSTRFGLRLRAVGENPAAVDTAGISVRALRYSAVMICGVLVGLVRRLSLDRPGRLFPAAHERRQRLHRAGGAGVREMAAVAGAGDLPAVRLPRRAVDPPAGRVIPGVGEVPVQAIQALPYVLTVVLLAGFIGKAIPPKASGVPYVKER